jgi:hypothetical protein
VERRQQTDGGLRISALKKQLSTQNPVTAELEKEIKTSSNERRLS